jgi:AmiR/NasT family two-component response regulator
MAGEKKIRLEVVRVLEKRGYEVVGQAATGMEALEKTMSLTPDVVLMDIKMPELDGLNGTRLIQEKCPTPVVILSAYETGDLLENASKVGAGAYLVKPLHPEEVDRALTIAMARHGDLMALKQLNEELRLKNEALGQALAEVKTLRDILPICTFCKKIRDDQGYWEQVESYILKHTDSKFSHGICPECLKKHYPDIAEDVLGNE